MRSGFLCRIVFSVAFILGVATLAVWTRPTGGSRGAFSDRAARRSGRDRGRRRNEEIDADGPVRELRLQPRSGGQRHSRLLVR